MIVTTFARHLVVKCGFSVYNWSETCNHHARPEFTPVSNISNTKKSVSSDIQTLRSGLKKTWRSRFFFFF